jgi:hypothetical protein
LVVHVDVTAVEIRQFGEAQARGIKQFEYGSVTVDESPIARNIEQTRHAIGVEVAGQAFLALRSGYRRDWIPDNVFLAHQVAKERARRRKPALNTAGAEALSKTRGGKSSDVFGVQSAPTVNPGLITECEQRLEVAPVVLASQGRQPALEFKVPDEAIDPAGISHGTRLSNASKRPR